VGLKAIVDSVESLPEAVRALYVAAPVNGPLKGKFILDVEPVGGFRLDDVDNLKDIVKKERTAKDEALARVKELGDIDVPAHRAAMEQLEKLKSASSDEKVQERIRLAVTPVKEKADKDAAAAKTELARRDAVIRKYLVRAQALQKAGALKNKPVDANVVATLIDHDADIVWTDGKDEPEVRFRDGAGGHRTTVKTGGGMAAMSMDEYLESLVEAHPGLFVGTDRGGTGGDGSSARAGRAGRAAYEISRADAADFSKWQAAEDAAAKAGRKSAAIVD